MSIRRGSTTISVRCNHPPRWRGQREAELAVMHRAQGIEAGTGETEGLDPPDESPVAKPCAQTTD